METLKQKLNARKTVLGTMLSEVANPNMARIMKARQWFRTSGVGSNP